MQILTISDTPTIAFSNFIMAWGDLPNDERFPIRIGRKYARDVWKVLWHDDALMAAFDLHKEEIRAAAEVAHRTGKPNLTLI